MSLPCQIVIEDFNRPQTQRHLFTEVNRTTVPGKLADMQVAAAGQSAERLPILQNHVVELTVRMVGGPACCDCKI